MDCHSYEVQIRELALRADQNESLQADNQKLKDFIKKQGVLLCLFSPNFNNGREKLQTWMLVCKTNTIKP